MTVFHKLGRKPKSGTRLSFVAITAKRNEMNAPTRAGRPRAAGTLRGIVRRG